MQSMMAANKKDALGLDNVCFFSAVWHRQIQACI